jgi:peptidylprolyl isomerase domain and WD repeat-containing protein 1
LFTFRSGLKGDYEFPERKVMFSSKMDSDLFEFVKHKTHAISITVSPDGKMFAAMSNDKKVRVFRFLSGQIAHECFNFLTFNASCSFKTWPV